MPEKKEKKGNKIVVTKSLNYNFNKMFGILCNPELSKNDKM